MSGPTRHGRPPSYTRGTPGPTSEKVMAGPRLLHPGRAHLLFTGPPEAAMDLGSWPTQYWFLPQSPDLIWSSDHSWCVATEIDFDSTLLGGDAALVDAVLADPALDAWPIDSEDCVGSSGDLINT